MHDYIVYKQGPINCAISYDEQSDRVNLVLIELIYRALPIIIGLVVSVVGYLKIVAKMRELPQTYTSEIGIYKLLWYPIGLIIIFSPTLLDPVISALISDKPVWYRAIRIFIPHSIGWINAVMYISLRKLYQVQGHRKQSEMSAMMFKDDSSFSNSLTASFNHSI